MYRGTQAFEEAQMDFETYITRDETGGQQIWTVSVKDKTKEPHKVVAQFPCYSEQQLRIIKDQIDSFVAYVEKWS